MLKALDNNPVQPTLAPELPVSAAGFPMPFAGTLEYNAPARGPWNIVHTGMLLPEAHQIFACAAGCLRGVVLTAGEMQAMERLSWISVSEEDMFNGELEENIIRGAAQIVQALPRRPKAVLLFISCIHLFAGCDMARTTRELEERFPDFRFIDCYMTPTMRKSGLTPDQLIRRQLYKVLPNVPPAPCTAAIIGNDRPTSDTSQLSLLLQQNGWQLRDLTRCQSYDQFIATADSQLLITTALPAVAAAKALAQRTGRKHLHLPLSYDFGEIRQHLESLAQAMGVATPDTREAEAAAQESLRQLRQEVGDTPIVIDYTATSRPLGLALMLLRAGLNVERVYADAFTPEENAAYQQLQLYFPGLRLSPTVHPAMLHCRPEKSNDACIAIGQKAAWFKHANHLVNILGGGGYWGFDGICRICQAIIDASKAPCDTDVIIQHKGMGCRSCIF